MKFILEQNASEEGQIALFITITTMFLLLFVGLFLTNQLIKQIKVVTEKSSSVHSYYLADTGAECASYKLIKSGLNIDDYNVGDEIFSENIFGGNYRVILRESDPATVIDIIGTYRQTSRNVELRW